MIDHVGIVIPVRDEEALLAGCLDALSTAVAGLRPRDPEPAAPAVTIVVVLDRCRDRSLDIVAAHPTAVPVVIDAGNVGQARAAGVEAVLAAAAGPPERTWVATTDADSVVPPDWLSVQLEHAGTGADAVVGTVRVDDWEGHPFRVRERWGLEHMDHDGHHHVHGANLGCRGSTYLAAGGFPPLTTGEDVAFVASLNGVRVRRLGGLAVTTSARREPRAAGGFGDHLLRLDAG